jgi:hypothetical protein
LLKRQITYENPFTNGEVTETHYFHISKADLVEMEIEEHGQTYEMDGQELTGMQAKLQRIIDSEDGKAIMAEFKDIIRRSYGRKEGERFIKTDEAWKDFSSSEAFSQLLFEICTQPDEAAKFVNGIVPDNLDKIAKEVQAQAEKITAGREAQAAAKASAGTSEGATPDSNGNGDAAAKRLQEIESATAENPVTLTQAEMEELDSDELKSGLATGRYKLA